MTLARRSLAGKNFISLNIMWAYREQASFAVRDLHPPDHARAISPVMNLRPNSTW